MIEDQRRTRFIGNRHLEMREVRARNFCPWRMIHRSTNFHFVCRSRVDVLNIKLERGVNAVWPPQAKDEPVAMIRTIQLPGTPKRKIIALRLKRIIIGIEIRLHLVKLFVTLFDLRAGQVGPGRETG